jgi:imidazolonepropionase-like amidohydrolase
VHLTRSDALQDLARAGIVAVRDAGTKEGHGLTMQRSPGIGSPLRIITAGRALSKRGGYGAFLGTAVETRQEIASEILKLKAEGTDIIKIIVSGVVSFEQPGTVTPGGFGRDEVRFIVDEAGSHGLDVMAHANGETAILNAADAGVRSIEHGFFMTEAALMSLREHNVYWVPTVGALQRAAERSVVRPEMAGSIEEEIERHLSMMGKAFRSGVPLAIGTDCVLPDPRYREAYEAELAYFRQAGIPDDEVLRIAVEGGMELLGIEKRVKGPGSRSRKA